MAAARAAEQEPPSPPARSGLRRASTVLTEALSAWLERPDDDSTADLRRDSVLTELMSPRSAAGGRGDRKSLRDRGRTLKEDESPRDYIWKRQLDIMNPGQAWLRREKQDLPPLVSNFRLEVLDGGTIKLLMAIFYVSVGIAFFTKIWSEQTLEINNICGGDAGLSFGDWNSDLCRSPRDRLAYAAGDPIPVKHMDFDTVACPELVSTSVPSGGACMKWEGELAGLSLLNRRVFISFILEATPKEGLTRDLWLTGWAHRVDGAGKPWGKPTLLPPRVNGGVGSEHHHAAMATNDTSKWPAEWTRLNCKDTGFPCDVAIMEEPLLELNHRRYVQILLLNADTVLPLLNTSVLALSSEVEPHINVAFVFFAWHLGLVDLVFRYSGMILALGMLVHIFWHLGCSNFFRVQPNFRLVGSRRAKPWLTEQRWMCSAVLFLLLYLNPLKLPAMMLEAEEGRNVDGPGWTMRDRIFLFCDRNLALYYVNFIRIFEIVILACCREKERAPKMSFRWADRKRAWIYWVALGWFCALLLQDWQRLYADYHNYYHREAGTIAGLTSGDVLSKQSFFTLLLLVWCVGMVYFFFSASSALLKQKYWATRSRQLSFRFFFFLYFWHVIYTFAQATYCWWMFNQGRFVFESLVCTDISTGSTVGDVIANGVFVLVFGFVFGPVVYNQGQLPPDPLTRRSEWIDTPWPAPWVQFLNRAGNSTTYFFFWQSDRARFRMAQEAMPEPASMRSAAQKVAHTIVDGARAATRRAREAGSRHYEAAKTRAHDMAATASRSAGQTVEAARTRFFRLSRWGTHEAGADTSSVVDDCAELPATKSDGVQWKGVTFAGAPDAGGQNKGVCRQNVSFGAVSRIETQGSDATMPATAGMYSAEKPKPLFCLETSVEMLCLSWEVYGGEPGSDHSSEKAGKFFPIDCERHGYTLLEVIRGSVEVKKQAGGGLSLLEVCDKRHDGHILSYRYVSSLNCANEQCPRRNPSLLPPAERPRRSEDLSRGMAYVCRNSSCASQPYMLCARCFKDGHQPGERQDESSAAVGELPKLGGAAARTHVMRGRMAAAAAAVTAGAVGTVRRAYGFVDFARHKAEDFVTAITSQEEEIMDSDLQAIICVGPPLGPLDRGRIVLSFRGTSCFQNVKTDAQFFRDPFDDMIHNQHWLYNLGGLRRMSGIGLPRCHRGFLRAFRTIEPEVLNRLRPIVQDYPNHEILCTGHSLGGALATLMSYSIRIHFPHLMPLCYTYGCPRVGNNAFRAFYDEAVPHTFRIVNQNDIVSTVPLGCCGLMFCHVGREVCVDNKGNLIIEPTFIEEFIGPTKAARTKLGLLKLNRGSFQDHMMGRYLRSLSRVATNLRVHDCFVRMAPDERPAWMRHRLRWRLDGDQRGVCVLCGEQGDDPATVCPESRQYHRALPLWDGWDTDDSENGGDAARPEAEEEAELATVPHGDRQHSFAELGVEEAASVDSGSSGRMSQKSSPASKLGTPTRRHHSVTFSNFSLPRPRRKTRAAAAPARPAGDTAAAAAPPPVASPAHMDEPQVPVRSCDACGKTGIMAWAGRCPGCGHRFAQASARLLRSPSPRRPTARACRVCGYPGLMPWANRCPSCTSEAAASEPQRVVISLQRADQEPAPSLPAPYASDAYPALPQRRPAAPPPLCHSKTVTPGFTV
eukprot:TRINITY_DN17167_c0_g1_i1.p1 TRINITY_DN17167_c0_g1~~TRINITY_DN17167_c0_g1_i1.p1  ORF type:complete len:1685 (+),score=531.62 TRINITY_DN17167_c0_g1_i1:87-5057(+)